MDTLNIEARRAMADAIAAHLGTTDREDPRFRALLTKALSVGAFVPPTPAPDRPTRADAPKAPRKRRRGPSTARPRYMTPDGVKRPKPQSGPRVPQRVTLHG